MLKFRKDSVFIILPIIFILLIGGALLWLKSGDTNISNAEQQQNESSSTPSNQFDLSNPNSTTSPNTQFGSASQQDIEVDCKMSLDAGQRLIVNEQT